MSVEVMELNTSGVIARRLNRSRDSVQNYIRTRNIQPMAKASGKFVYSDDAVKQIAEGMGVQQEASR